ncbi:MAG: hypothetical protein Q8S17_13910 [Humidesulfovibrio sp.]|nr:hypothetical protein [Humidesulfovibrio sp.]
MSASTLFQPAQHQLVLELPSDTAFLPSAAAAAENAAQVFGLDRGGALRLALAVEEFFAYLCRHAGREEPIRLTLSDGGTLTRADFRFRAGEVSLRALNFAASVDLGAVGEGSGADSGQGSGDDAELGLLVAARTTDRCGLTRSGPDVFHVSAEVDRAYPEAEAITTPQRLSAPLRLEPAPGSGALQHAALLAAGRYPARLRPHSFTRPARFADMVATGQHQALLALDAAARPAGLICWRGSGRHAVVFSGPYVFDPALAEDTARLLTEGFLARVARTEALCAFSERPTADLPRGWFEALGSLTLHGEAADGGGETEPVDQPAFFRHLREDAGAAVWAHPDLFPFLRREYDRLAFSRDLLAAEPTPPARLPAHSLLATTLDRQRRLAVLRPLLDGRDFETNLRAHVEAIREQGTTDILLHLDLAEPWAGALYPALAACGFTPRLVLPHAGDSDILVCQHVPGHS